MSVPDEAEMQLDAVQRSKMYEEIEGSPEKTCGGTHDGGAQRDSCGRWMSAGPEELSRSATNANCATCLPELPSVHAKLR